MFAPEPVPVPVLRFTTSRPRRLEATMTTPLASELSPLLWAAVSLVIAAGAAHLAFAWLALAPSGDRADRLYRLAGGGLSLATGIWAAHGISASIDPVGRDIEHALGVELAIGLLATALCMGAFAAAALRHARFPAWLPVACGLGTVLVALQMFGTYSTLDTAGAATVVGSIVIEWRAIPLAVAWLSCMVGGLLAFGLVHALRGMNQRAAGWGGVAAGAILGATVSLSQHLVAVAAGMPLLMAPGAVGQAPGTAFPAWVALTAAGSLLALHALLRRRSRAAAERAQTRQTLAARSLNDPLTGLPNRPMFEGTLAQAVRQADDGRHRLALLYINLDGFMPFNQSFGQNGGDQVLRTVAKRLRNLARPHMAARLAGDEFLLLLTGDPRVEDASDLACSVLASIGQPFAVAGREISITASIGLALYPEHGALSTLIGHADTAMRTAKAAGGASHALFDSRMVNGLREQADLLRDLRVALERGQIELYYQPKIHAPTGEISGVEALMRWHHPQRGMVSPVVFIPLAERYGLIGALGQWVIDEACRQARAWRDSGLRMRVAINLSVHQLRQVDLAERIGAALQRHKINPDLITCELTESAAMDDTEVTMRVLGELAALGLHISIDDFGTGHSSLAYLRKLPAHELKIDRSFVSDLETSEDARKVASAVINLAKALNLKVVAEGVETEAQNRILREFGCDQLQGFLFAKPMSAKALALWAMDDVGPRTMNFRDSLFVDTLPAALV